MLKLKGIFFFLSLFMLYFGAEEVYVGWKNPEPTRITVADYVKSDKSKEWVVLTDARINLLKAVTMRKKDGEITGLYIPIESAGSTENDTVSLLLETDDEAILNVVRQLSAMPEAKLLEFLVREKDQLIRSYKLSGRVKSKDSMKSGKEGEVREHIKNLASDFYVLKHDSSASLMAGLILMGIGLLMLTTFVWMARRSG